MINNPKVSVIVPVYNVEKYLERCLDSLINQTLKDIEIIAVNDGSTDNSLEILNKYAEKDTRIKVINKKNEGVSVARNIGIDESEGEYLTFVDSDDWIDKEMLYDMYKYANNTSVDIVMCTYIREFRNHSKIKRLDIDCEYKQYVGTELENLHRKLVGPIKQEIGNPEYLDALSIPVAKLYKVDLLKKNNLKFIDINIIGTGEDSLFNIHVFKYVNNCILINKDYYHYWKENDYSITTIYKPNLKDQWKNLFKYIREFLDENNLKEEFYEALNNRICIGTLGLGINECSNSNELSIINNLKYILNEDYIVEAFKSFDIKYFNLHWKIFYWFNKKRMYLVTYCMLKVINILRKVI